VTKQGKKLGGGAGEKEKIIGWLLSHITKSGRGTVRADSRGDATIGSLEKHRRKKELTNPRGGAPKKEATFLDGVVTERRDK